MSAPDPAYLSNPARVKAQYASERNLHSRSSLYTETTGPFAGDIAFEAVREVDPGAVLEVGCGTGWFAERVRDELGADVVALDQSERMVELAYARGLDARVGDVQELPFADGVFDCVAANWMLYHVPDLDRGLREIVRVLRPGGRLVAITNGRDHLHELWDLVGAAGDRATRVNGFTTENGHDVLARWFARVEMRDAGGTVRISDPEAVVRYIGSMDAWKQLVERVPESFAPFSARRSNVVFVAET